MRTFINYNQSNLHFDRTAAPKHPLDKKNKNYYDILQEEEDDNIEDESNKGNSNNNDLNESKNDLDVPGSELDDEQEKLGSEDEENNYYSIGGDNHNNLEENQE